MSINCVVVDAGARYGLHPSWAPLLGLADFHLFEMDAREADRLKRKYQSERRIKVYPLALYSSDTVLSFRVSEHEALNSVFASNEALLKKNEYMVHEFTVNEERKTQARSLDSLFSDQEVHFLKLDVEGAEYEVLKGGRRLLSSSVLGVRSEVVFAPIYMGAPLFGDLHSLLLEHGFELLNFDYAGGGNKTGRFTMPGRYGKLLSTDAVWVIGNDRLFSAKTEKLAHDVVRFALFLMNNGATDLAVDTLSQAVTRRGVSLETMIDDPLCAELHREILFLFKALLGLPMLQEADITTTYETLFHRKFPLMNRFYETVG
ncbi:MAG: FkbM family methyltransferase [Xanthobacteraceae bacterium]